jgi:hypothetical protein
MRNLLLKSLSLLCAVSLAFLSCACDRESGNTATDTLTPPTSAAPAATQPLPTLQPTAPRIGITTLPADSQALNKIEEDMNGDGATEQIVSFRTSSGDGIAIGDWRVVFPTGYLVEEIQVRHLRDQKIPEVLAFVRGENPQEHYLYLYVWQGSSFAALKPEGGPDGGLEAFRSDYLRPLAEDGDFNGTEEIVLCKVASNPSYLEIVFYEWDEGAFRHTTRFLAVPLHIPPEMLTPTAVPKGN